MSSSYKDRLTVVDRNYQTDNLTGQRMTPADPLNSGGKTGPCMDSFRNVKGMQAGRADSVSGENLIIETRNDPRKLMNLCIFLGVFFIVLGIISVMLGKGIDNSISWYSRRDFDEFMIDVLFISGYIDFFLGILMPFLPKLIPDRPILYVYSAHVEGKRIIRGSLGQVSRRLTDFNEPIFNISSVSEDPNSIILNMKDGRFILHCAISVYSVRGYAHKKENRFIVGTNPMKNKQHQAVRNIAAWQRCRKMQAGTLVSRGRKPMPPHL